MDNAFHFSKLQIDKHKDIIEEVLNHAVEAACLIDKYRTVAYISPGFTALTGQDSAAYYRQNYSMLKIQETEKIEQVMQRGQSMMSTPMHVGSQLVLVNLIPMISEQEVAGVFLLCLIRSPTALRHALASLDAISQEAADTSEDVYDKLSRRSESSTFSDFVGEDTIILETIEQCERIAKIKHPVLLIGETGVGKEIIASAIYETYRNGANIPFVKINCSAIPRDLLESELFGYEKGAFTGASSTRKGRFEQAAGGVLLLDEIGEMDINLQSKLLRVLESREFERVGGGKSIPLTARIIASTNQNLKQMVAKGAFRMDLYFRLNVFEINLPPLRAHKRDIPLLLEHFSRTDNLHLEFSSSAWQMILDYDWPGNVRQLRNVFNRLSFLYPNTVLSEQQVYLATGELECFNLNGSKPSGSTYDQSASKSSYEKPLPAEPHAPMSLKDAERCAIIDALAAHQGNLAKAAATLEISRTTLYEKLKRHQIEPV